jgi:NAD(P)-dependent dehydrogenase (short-subunit alcohol dehydrogenase family)
LDLELTGKRAVVTGASRGIGRAIAASLLGEGARVTICARDEMGLAATAAELSQLGEVHHRRADLADSDDAAALVDWAAETMGGVDILVSNVSALGGADFATTFNVDIQGAHTLARRALGHMADHADANIVFIGSRAGSVGVPWMPAYCAMKAATVSMAKSMAVEVARRGIRINVVSPGDVKFPGGSWEQIERENPKLFDAVIKENPFRRMARPKEIADVVTFVASSRASFITGTNVLVDGGATKGLQL